MASRRSAGVATAVVFTIGGCTGPTAKDVQVAIGRHDVQALQRLANEHDPRVWGAAVSELVKQLPEDQVASMLEGRVPITPGVSECLLREASDDPASLKYPGVECAARRSVLKTLLEACRERPSLAATAAAHFLVAAVDERLLTRVIAGLSNSCPEAFQQILTSEAARMREQFSQAPDKAEAEAVGIAALDVPDGVKLELMRTALDLQRRTLLTSKDAKVLQVLQAADKAQKAFGTSSASGRCLRAEHLVAVVTMPVSLPTDDPLPGSADLASCPEVQPQIATALSRRCTEVQGRIAGLGPVVATSSSTPALIGELMGVLNTLENAFSVGEARPVARDAAAIIDLVNQAQAAAEAIASLQGEEQSAQDALHDLRENRREFRYLTGYMVAQPEANVYEVIVEGRRAVLKTVMTGFRTQGYFEIWVTNQGTEEIRTTSGFIQTWPVFIEAERSAVKDIDDQIAQRNTDLRRARTSRLGAARRLQSLTTTVRRRLAIVFADASRLLSAIAKGPGSQSPGAPPPRLAAVAQRVASAKKARDSSSELSDANDDAVASAPRLTAPHEVQQDGEEGAAPLQLTDAQVMSVLRQNKRALDACTSAQEDRTPDLAVRVAVKFKITGDGGTTRVVMEPDPSQFSAMRQCLSEAIDAWQFPRFSGPPMPIEIPLRVGGR